MQTIVGVLRGGPSREHAVSLETGAHILAHIPSEQFLARDIYIDKQGVWHDRGRPLAPERVLRQIDVALIALHGDYGEDGQIQKLLERFGVRYAGSDAFGSQLALHKLLSKARANDLGLLTPAYRYLTPESDHEAVVLECVRAFHQPVVVKPAQWGSSIGVSLAGGYAAILDAVEKLFADGAHSILIEEFIRGKEATVGVVEELRGESLYALPAVEIEPLTEEGFFTYRAKYAGDTRERCPGTFSRFITEDLQRAAKLMHRTLGLRHYSRSDFRVSPRGIYYLETNTLPGLTEESLFPKALAAVGVSMKDFVSHLVKLAQSR